MKILFADDRADARLTLEKVLTAWGFEVATATNGDEAWEQLRFPTPPSIAILGWELSGLDGLEVCRRARHISIPVYVIILMGDAVKDSAAATLEAGADDCLAEPYAPEELHARIKTGARIVALQEELAKRTTTLEVALSERKITEEALHESEQRFRYTFDQAAVGIAHVGLDGQWLMVNQRLCDITGYSRDELQALSLQDVADADDLAVNLEYMRRLMADEVSDYSLEMRYLRKDSSPIWLDFTVSLVRDSLGTPQYFIAIIEHISERKRTGQIVQRARQEWMNTVDAVPDMIILEGADARVRRCNKAVVSFLGLQYAEIIDETLHDLFLPQLHGEAIEPSTSAGLFREAMRETQFPGKEGWHEITTHPLPPDNDGDAGWVHIIKDVTMRRQSEAMTQRLMTAIEQAADAVLITDAEGCIQYVNPSFETTGWSREEALGQQFFDLQGQSTQSEIYKEIIETIEAGRVWHGTYSARRKDSSTYDEEATVSPVRDAEGNLLNYVLVRRDVSEKKRLESIADAVNMMENVGYIFSGIRHELGNPINSAKTALSVLHKNIKEWSRPQVITYIERALTEIGRVEYLLKALKTFSMHENPRMQEVEMIPFLENFLSLIESDFAQRGIQIKPSFNLGVGAALADPRALHQVLLNLLANAADALEGRDNASIFLGLSSVASRIEVKVIDNGIGLSDQQCANLFKPFHTTKPHGTGLGLVIVKKMIVKMGGTIDIKSQLNVGTEVIVSLEAAANI